MVVATQINYEEVTFCLPPETEKTITRVVALWLRELRISDRFVSIFFCGAETSQSLNHQYRNKNQPTDILSFSYESDEAEPDIPIEEYPWGELVICPEIVEAQAKTAGLSYKNELIRLLAHGVTHLRGLDHQDESQEAEMLSAEIELLSLVGLGDIYR